MRMCCGCRTQQSTSNLIRLQICKQTHTLIPLIQKQSGRSAWVCFNVQCIQSIIKHPKKLHRSLRSTPNMTGFKKNISQWIEGRCKVMLSRLHIDGVLTLEESHTAYRNIYIWSQTEQNTSFKLFHDTKQWSNYTLTTYKQSSDAHKTPAFQLTLSKQHRSISQLYINLGILEALQTE
jgi:predicted RNA-binding protein YlxR (DUF448 family)